MAYHFAPENVSGTHRAIHFARSLHEHGHDVRVVAPDLASLSLTDPSLDEVFPYSDQIVRVPKTTTLDSLYKRFKRRLRRSPDSSSKPLRDTMPGSAPHSTQSERTLLRVMRRHLSAAAGFPDEHRGWYRPAVRAGLKIARRTKLDAVFVSGPPWTPVIAAWTISRKVGCPLVVDCRDPWTANAGSTKEYPTSWFHELAKLLEKRVFRTARLVLTNSPGIKHAADEAYRPFGCPPVRVILNGSDAPQREQTEQILTDIDLVIRHFGSLYSRRAAARSLLPLYQALDRAVIDAGIPSHRVRVELFAPGHLSPDTLNRWRNGSIIPTQIRPMVPYREATRMMLDPSVLIVVQPRTFNRQIPTKLYDYLCSGNPILVMAPEDSATWEVARRFSRCRRLDDVDSHTNRATMQTLLDQWQSGDLHMERSVEDTATLTKDAIGRDFVEVIAGVLAQSDTD